MRSLRFRSARASTREFGGIVPCFSSVEVSLKATATAGGTHYRRFIYPRIGSRSTTQEREACARDCPPPDDDIEAHAFSLLAHGRAGTEDRDDPRGSQTLADEIIVAVDTHKDPSRLGHQARVADRIVRYEWAPPNERARPWLYSLCSGAWILQIDDDEVLSRYFLERLPDLRARDRTYRQHSVPCHWLFPDATHWLDENTVVVRRREKLIRNDPATMSIPGISHATSDPAFPSTHLERGFYRLDSLLRDESTRREKVRYYLGIENRYRIESTDKEMAAFYLPELVPGVRPVRVPREDHEAIVRVLAATGEESPRRKGWPYRSPPGPRSMRAGPPELADSAYEAELKVIDRVIQLTTGDHRPIHVRVSNGGDRDMALDTTDSWVALCVSYRWLALSGTSVGR